jgi:hypothetical protein
MHFFLRLSALLAVLGLVSATLAADVESRVLTHYVPQDFLENAVRKEGWTEVPLAVKGGVRKGDTIRIWAGGSIDRGNGDQPGQNVNGPSGPEPNALAEEKPVLALASEPALTFALLFKTETSGLKKCLPPGKPLEITLTKDKEPLWIGFNDERGRYHDNHLGKGRRHELDPLWIRIEVIRTIVD